MRRLEVSLYMVLMLVAPGLWDAFEYAVGTLGQKMHKYHNQPDIRPQVSWADWTVMDSFITGVLASWWLVLPTMLVCIAIYQHKRVILSHVHANIPIAMSNRAIRWLRVYVAIFSVLPFGIYWFYDRFVSHPFRELALEAVTRQSVEAIDGNLLFVHVLYYAHGVVFIVIGMMLSILVHGRDGTEMTASKG